MTPVVVRPAAAADIEEAFVWYEGRRPGLGDEFLAALQLALQGNPHFDIRHADEARAALRTIPHVQTTQP